MKPRGLSLKEYHFQFEEYMGTQVSYIHRDDKAACPGLRWSAKMLSGVVLHARDF